MTRKLRCSQTGSSAAFSSGGDPEEFSILLEVTVKGLGIKQSPMIEDLRSQRFDAAGDVTEIDVGAVDFHEIIQRGLFVTEGLISRRQIIINGTTAAVVQFG